jgi:hypothetical protein
MKTIITSKEKRERVSMINTFSQESLHISIKGFTHANDMCYVVTARLHLTKRRRRDQTERIGDSP